MGLGKLGKTRGRDKVEGKFNQSQIIQQISKICYKEYIYIHKFINN